MDTVRGCMRVTSNTLRSRLDSLSRTMGILNGLRDPNLLGDNPTYLQSLRHAKLGTVDLHRAAMHPDFNVREALCRNPACPPAILDTLLQDPVWVVRWNAQFILKSL